MTRSYTVIRSNSVYIGHSHRLGLFWTKNDTPEKQNQSIKIKEGLY
jgi:hypothetical protein